MHRPALLHQPSAQRGKGICPKPQHPHPEAPPAPCPALALLLLWGTGSGRPYSHQTPLLGTDVGPH